MVQCALAYRDSRQEVSGVAYFGLSKLGIPFFTCMIGRGRDAWIVTQLALEHQLTRHGMENLKVTPE